MTELTNRTATHEAAFDVLSELNKNAEQLRKGNAQVRDALISDCFRLVAELETPGEAFMRILWTHTIHPAVMRLASDIQLFDLLKAAEGRARSSAELAEMTSADQKLISKTLKTLATCYLVKEVEADKFVSTPFSDAMASETYKLALGLMVPFVAKANLIGPEYFQQRNYKWPDDAKDVPGTFATGDAGKLNFFEVMKKYDKFPGLESLMKVWLDKRPHWSDEAAGYYPIRKRLIQGAETGPEAAFLVDLGGGHGQDFLRLLANVPENEIPGRLILQDLPHVIDDIAPGSLPDKVEKMQHDFFTEQPIKDARIYFMHNILHNHMDENAKKVLKQTAAAMKKGYSKLLLWDNIMPNCDAGTILCALDWEMLTFYGTSERTEADWRKLLEDPEIGLKVADIIHYSRYDQDVIELELA